MNWKNTRSLPAPTSRALSTMDSEMPDSAAEMIMVAKGILNQQFIMRMPFMLYSRPGFQSYKAHVSGSNRESRFRSPESRTIVIMA